MKKGFLVTFEGGDGCGKSTQLELFKKYLTESNIDSFVQENPAELLLGKI